ncbi:MAG: FtsX-like permease family protein, partial [Bacteroidota bacterium]
LLIMACINYVNLSTAKASIRAKEIGVKKTFGVRRTALIKQHLLESFIMITLSTVLAFLLVRIALPEFNVLAGKELSLQASGELIVGVALIILLTTLAAGSYPAIFLSGLKPIHILKGKWESGSSGKNSKETVARKGLVIFQFIVSIVMIVGVLIVNKQIGFIQEKNLGYDKENLLYFSLEESEEDDGAFAILNEIEKVPGVISVSNFSDNLYGDHGSMSRLDWREGDDDQQIRFRNLEVGYNFLETAGIIMKEGRTFSANYGNDENKIIINEKAAQVMGFSHPLGETVKFWGEGKEIIGVTRDFHFESLHEDIQPCIIELDPSGMNVMVRMDKGAEQEAVQNLSKLYQRFYAGLPFEYTYAEESQYQLYVAEHRVSMLSKYFAGIGILISCLGLFGLATFTAERRRKELGIRKVLGASALNLVKLLSKDFSIMVGFGIFLGLPIGYVLSQLWLENFAYRMELSLWYFVLSAIITLVIAWITVGLQTYKAASLNPVESLRND